MEKSVWNCLNRYYRINGISFICCMPVNSYSHNIYYYDDIHIKDDLNKIIDYSYDLFLKNGYKPDMYEIQVLCSTSLVYPLSTYNFISCLYMLDLEKCIIIDENTIKELYNYVYDGRVVFVALRKR